MLSTYSQTAAGVQARLETFYRAELATVRDQFNEADLEVLSFPFLLKISPEYLAAPIRLMFVGKETNRWAGKLGNFYAAPEATVTKAVDRYETQYRERWKRWSTPFGRQYKSVVRALGLEATPQATIWNNLIKMDWNQGNRNSRRALGHSPALRALSTNMFRREVELLEPHVIVFATGASYDGAIKAAVPVSAWHDQIPAALSTFTVGGAKCVRLRHPGAIPSKNFPMPTAEYYERVAHWLKVVRTQPAALCEWPPADPSIRPAV